MRYAIWYHLYDLKNVKNTHGGVLILVTLQAKACNFTKINTTSWVFFTFFKLYIGTKSRNASQIFFYSELPNISKKTWRGKKTNSKAITQRYVLQGNAIIKAPSSLTFKILLSMKKINMTFEVWPLNPCSGNNVVWWNLTVICHEHCR